MGNFNRDFKDLSKIFITFYKNFNFNIYHNLNNIKNNNYNDN